MNPVFPKSKSPFVTNSTPDGDVPEGHCPKDQKLIRHTAKTRRFFFKKASLIIPVNHKVEGNQLFYE